MKVSLAQQHLQIVLERPADENSLTLDVAVELYPVDVVAVRHEFFTEPRAENVLTTS